MLLLEKYRRRILWAAWMCLQWKYADDRPKANDSKTIDTTGDFELLDTGYGVPQRIRIRGKREKETRSRIDTIDLYMRYGVVDESNPNVSLAMGCQLRHENCAFWSVIGQCETNSGYMKTECAPACFSCDHLDFETRCPMPTVLNNTWPPGALNAMFDRIVSARTPENQQLYDVQVVKQPKKRHSITTTGRAVTWDEVEPWVMIIHNFLTESECDTLIQLGANRGYTQSMSVGAKKFDGTDEGRINPRRTSTNTWCQNECMENPVTKTVIAKIETLTGIPQVNGEDLQLLKYEEGQFYQQHHDYIAEHVERAQGVRILTVFLYLNDVEEGGGTNFPYLDVTVRPKRGRALVWPSVWDQEPHVKDPRTVHQALPVVRGIKYGANAWLHQRDFQTPFRDYCA